jgi:hypothetical protein
MSVCACTCMCIWEFYKAIRSESIRISLKKSKSKNSKSKITKNSRKYLNKSWQIRLQSVGIFLTRSQLLKKHIFINLKQTLSLSIIGSEFYLEFKHDRRSRVKRSIRSIRSRSLIDRIDNRSDRDRAHP